MLYTLIEILPIILHSSFFYDIIIVARHGQLFQNSYPALAGNWFVAFICTLVVPICRKVSLNANVSPGPGLEQCLAGQHYPQSGRKGSKAPAVRPPITAIPFVISAK